MRSHTLLIVQTLKGGNTMDTNDLWERVGRQLKTEKGIEELRAEIDSYSSLNTYGYMLDAQQEECLIVISRLALIDLLVFRKLFPGESI